MGSKLRRLRRATSVTPTSIPVPPLRGHGPSTVDSDLMVRQHQQGFEASERAPLLSVLRKPPHAGADRVVLA
jgi:hypothetical protein